MPEARGRTQGPQGPSPSSRSCPCCGQALPRGLFEWPARVAKPWPVSVCERIGEGISLYHPSGLVLLHERFFLPASLGLPLHWPETPVRCLVWVEVEEELGERFCRLAGGFAGERFAGEGTLACDVPGFRGTFGARVSFLGELPGELRVSACADARIAQLGRERRLAHEELAALYRVLWGGPARIADADERLRALTLKALNAHGHGLYFATEVPVMPNACAGIKPPLLAIRPPRDSGGEARLATVGIAEAMQGAERYELVTAARNGGDAFERSFAEFCFWSRAGNDPLRPGSAIREPAGTIPGTRMAAWLIVSQVETEEGPLCPPAIRLEGQLLRFLAAVPITEREFMFAGTYGTRELSERLREVDVGDLARSSCVEDPSG